MEDIDDFKKIYDMLEDEESKEILLYRLAFNISGNDTYMKECGRRFCKACTPEFKGFDIYPEIEKKGKNGEIVLYGAGQWTNWYMQRGGWNSAISVKMICDRDENKQNKEFAGKIVISPEEMVTKYAGELVLIGTGKRYEKEVYQFLRENQIPEESIYRLSEWGKKGSPQYFYEEFITFEEEEIFVDGGVLDLQSTVNLKKKCNQLTKSYAFEPGAENIKRCRARIQDEKLDYVELLPYALWSKREKLFFSDEKELTGGGKIANSGNVLVDAEAIDNLIHEKVTFIKLDIEGSELEALKGAQNLIKTWKPKLAICLYHKPEDIYKIPSFIKSLVPEYKLYIRHHSNLANETVLYAVI